MLDDHILDCEICRRVTEARWAHEADHGAASSLDEILSRTVEENNAIWAKMPPLYIAPKDFAHIASRGMDVPKEHFPQARILCGGTA